MPTKIRLQRHGKKRYAYFHVVIADSRAPRDGKFIEKLGTYNPNTNPATIDIDFDGALSWIKKGAQPTDTVKALLSYKGVIYKNHLDKGVIKGAFSQEEADKKFAAWLEEKEAKVGSKIDTLSAAVEVDDKKRFEAEQVMNKKRADAIAAKNAELAAAVMCGNRLKCWNTMP
ncbi:MAG: 30S ribosomal protein S16, partial [Flavobacteriales bacterium]|nr:30S ribosomal protein S16 [Flavobacteriales bacterium]